MADENKAEQFDEEQAKLFFEYYKHLTTLNVATALVMLAVYREAVVQSVVTAGTLTVLGLSLIISGFGMMLIPLGSYQKRFHRGAGYLAGMFFLAGVGAFALFALGV